MWVPPKLGPARAERVRHEVSVLERLSGVDHIVQLAEPQPDAETIQLKDVGGVSLAQTVTPVDSSSLVDLMLGLARAVGEMHQRGVVHGDINPGNVVVAGESAVLIDFALAVTFAELRPEFTSPKEIVGTLPYLAPEQTGRTGRLVDRRADLYGLGATMYELATGRPPLGTGDPIRLIHDHLARAAVPPAQVNPAVPPALSEIIMHLLEKEPDNRYQTAEGLVRDLERVRGGARWQRVGADDVPLRLSEPSRLVGRDGEIGGLGAAFEAARVGQSRAVAVSGGSGVGKSALLDQLRPMVSAADGWLASGKFDRYRRDLEHDGVAQAFRRLGRLLLAEPEDKLAEIRPRLLRTLGPNAGLTVAALPEFATVLKVAPDPGDPLTAQARAVSAGVGLLRAVASRERPVVLVVDDVQWAGATPLRLLDQLLSGDEQVEGLLTVVAYREEVDQADPVATLLARWRSQPGRPEQVRITNLDPDNLTAMIAEMLHSARESVVDLAHSVFRRTDGNPYATVELLNGLRREGVLRPTATGWWWDPATVRRHLARENVAELMQTRVDAMPAATRDALEAMACLGGQVELPTLAIATDLPAVTLEQQLAPALDDGLLVVAGRQAARFRHDQLRDIVLSAISSERLAELRLRLARRLAPRTELFAVAAEQYLPVIEAVRDPQERRNAALLLRRAAEQSLRVGESLPAEKMLATAVRLIDDREALLTLHTARHAALYRLGRLSEADEIYQRIGELSAGPHERLDATRVQISSLVNRSHPADAIALGLDLLGQLGWTVPTSPQQLDADIEAGLDWLYSWMDQTSAEDDLRRPDVSDPTMLAIGALISRMMPACYFGDQATMACLALTAARTWADHGPTRTLVGVLSYLPIVLTGRRQDYRSASQSIHRVLTVGEQRDYEPDLSEAHFFCSSTVMPWFKPIEQLASAARRAREGLVRGGELLIAAYTYLPTSVSNLDHVSLDECAAEIDAALAFPTRTGNEQAAGTFKAHRWLIAFLRGEFSPADDQELAIPTPTDPPARANIHIAQGLAAVLFHDPDVMMQHSQAAMAVRQFVEPSYASWQLRLVRAIALAERVRTTAEHAAELTELDETVGWMAARASDMPTNFGHLVNLIEAERAWALRDFHGALHAFDSALRNARHRPWHRAYIAERWAKLLFAHGLDHLGWPLLVEAREAYRAWGAQAKVDQLGRSYPSLDIPTEPSPNHTARRTSITGGAIDMLGILAASRALSSQTSIGALRARLVEVLSSMTGATDISLLVWSAEQHRWLAATDDGNGQISSDQLLPYSIIRYVERTREPLIVADATQDDRFATDPYFTKLSVCAVLAVPVLSRGALQAILLLENHLIRDAFPAERLEGVVLVAGQLAISLENAASYRSLEQRVAERTQQLAHANQRLEQLSITDPLTGLANRRRFDESLQDEWSRVGRTRAPLSLAMVDIDHFKRYNDLHGHPAGDECLQRVATQLAGTIRTTDLAARYGGEEFAIIMPDTGSAAAREAAERVRIAITELAEPLDDNEIVTASIGVATLDDPEHDSIDQLIERADAALYQAKRAGRNRVDTAPTDRNDPWGTVRSSRTSLDAPGVAVVAGIRQRSRERER